MVVDAFVYYLTPPPQKKGNCHNATNHLNPPHTYRIHTDTHKANNAMCNQLQDLKHPHPATHRRYPSTPCCNPAPVSSFFKPEIWSPMLVKPGVCFYFE